MTEQINQGSLKYNLSTNDFSINPTGTADGWVSLPISSSAEHVTKEDLKTWAEKLGGQNQSSLYVSQSAPLASDSKNNRGNSKLRPFKTIERALAEAARISFRKNPLGDTSQNDAFERISISIAPGEYEVQNGPRSLIDTFDYYSEYQDASYLVGENRDSIVNIVSDELISPNDGAEYQNDLEYITNSIIRDLTSAGNFYTLRTVRSFVTADPSVVKTDPEFYVTRYDSLTKRNTLLTTALNILAIEVKKAIQNLGVSTDNSIVIEGEALTAISSTIDSLVNIVYNTLVVADPLDPRNNDLIKYGSYSAAFFPVEEPTRADLQRFNSLNSSGIILPRGVSLIGEDLRKVVIRPTYVPNPYDTSVGRGTIFKMTGANFFSGFTIKDRKPLGLSNISHHKLSAFEFCSKDELDSYYVGVNNAFSDPSIYNRAVDSANLIEKNEEWIQNNSAPKFAATALEETFARIFEGEIQNILVAIQKDLRGLTNENSISLGRRFNNDHILPLSNDIAPGESESPRTQAINYYTDLIADPSDLRPDDIYGLVIDAATNSGGIIDPDIADSEIESIELNGETFTGRYADIQAAIYIYIQLIVSLLADGSSDVESLGNFADVFTADDIEVINPETSIVLGLNEEEENLNLNSDKINTVLGASPYIFNASIRSEYGMCGIDGDGNKAMGLKSYLAAQFTIVSLQKDQSAYLLDSSQTGGKRFRGSLLSDQTDYRHFGFKVKNSAYAQLVSCFCIGPAIHYLNESGSELSITNSTSNFGDISLYSYGFNDDGLGGGSYPQDRGFKLIGIKKPEPLDITIRKFNVGNITSVDFQTGEIILAGPTVQRGYTLKTYSLVNEEDSNLNSNVYVNAPGVELSAKVISYSENKLDPLNPTVSIFVDINDLSNWSEFTLNDYNVFIKRYRDDRQLKDKKFYLIIEGDFSNGTRSPLVDYIIRKSDVNTNAEQPLKAIWDSGAERGALYYIDSNERILNPETEDLGQDPVGDKQYYLITSLSAYSTIEGDIEYRSSLDRSCELNLDLEPDFININQLHLDNLSYKSVNHLIRLLGVTDLDIPDSDFILNQNRFINLNSNNLFIDFNKPSITRASGQTWEFCGYFNYSTGLPKLQTKALGEGLPRSLAILERFKKLQTLKIGGRVYATGMDEQGNLYQGPTIIDFKTGTNTAIDLGADTIPIDLLENDDTPLPTNYPFLTIENLLVSDEINFDGKILNLSSNPVINAENGLELVVGGDSILKIDEQGNILLSEIPGSRSIISSTAPTQREDGSNLKLGDIWFNSVNGLYFIWYISSLNNGNWVALTV